MKIAAHGIANKLNRTMSTIAWVPSQWRLKRALHGIASKDEMGRIHKVSRQIVCGANRLARFSTRIHFVWWSSTSEVWRTFMEGKFGYHAQPSLLGRPRVLYKNGVIQIWVGPRKNGVCFWRNIHGSTLEARQACRGQSEQCRSVSFHHPSADASLQKQSLVAIPLTNTPTSSKRTPMLAESTSSGDVDRVVIRSNHRRRRARFRHDIGAGDAETYNPMRMWGASAASHEVGTRSAIESFWTKLGGVARTSSHDIGAIYAIENWHLFHKL